MNGAHPLLKFISLSSWVSMKSSVVSRNDNVHALIFTRYLFFNGLANISLSLCTNIYF